MPYYSKKYHLQNDIYKAFIASFFNSGIFTKKVFNRLYLNQILKKQQYLSSQISIFKSN